MVMGSHGYAIVRFELLPEQLAHPCSPFLEFFQPFLANAFCPLGAELEVREVQFHLSLPDCFCVRQAQNFSVLKWDPEQ